LTKRLPTLPDVPTISRGRSAGVRGRRLVRGDCAGRSATRHCAEDRRDTTRVIRQANFVAALAAQSGEPIGGTPEEFAAFLRADYSVAAHLQGRPHQS